MWMTELRFICKLNPRQAQAQKEFHDIQSMWPSACYRYLYRYLSKGDESYPVHLFSFSPTAFDSPWDLGNKELLVVQEK